MKNMECKKEEVKDREQEEESNSFEVRLLVQRILDHLHSNITASVVYENPYDYSSGVKCAEVDYFPESADELLAEIGIELQLTTPKETEPYGYVFEGRLYKSLDELKGQTFSDGNEPVAVYRKSNQHESK